MTSATRTQTLSASTRQPLRLRLKPKAPTTGHVDGAWWPRSRDLAAEVTELVEVLSIRLGGVTKVAFAPTAWDAAPRHVDVDGHPVRLVGSQPPDDNVLHVTGADRRRLRLLVVPPEASEASGHEAMMRAGTRDNADSPAEILIAAGLALSPMSLSGRDADEDADRWEADGGHVRDRS